METFFIEYMFTLHARDEMMEFYNTKQKSLRYISISKASIKTAATYSPTNAVPSA